MNHRNPMVGMRLVVVLMLGAIGATACGGSDAGPTTLAPTTTAAESGSVAVPSIVQEFEEAYESGDLDRVRELFTPDGIITTASNTYGMHAGETLDVGVGFVDGPEFERLARLHAGEDLTIIGTPIEIGDTTVAFGWEWSDFGSGTALLHLRDGKIVVAILDVSQVPIPG